MSTSCTLSSSACSFTEPQRSINLASSALTPANGLDNQDSNVRVDAIRSRTDLSSSAVISGPLHSDIPLENRDLTVSVPIKELEQLLKLNHRMQLVLTRILNSSPQSAGLNQQQNSTSGSALIKSDEHDLKNPLGSASKVISKVHEKNSMSDEKRIKSKKRIERAKKSIEEMRELLRQSEARLADKSEIISNFKKV